MNKTIINQIGLAFGKEIATVNTASLNGQSNSCLRSPHKLKFAGTPKNADGHKTKF